MFKKQEDVTARPNMSAVVLILNSNSINLPAPSPPAYFFDGRMESSFQTQVHSSQGNHSEEVPLNSSTVSVNDVSSIAEFEPH